MSLTVCPVSSVHWTALGVVRRFADFDKANESSHSTGYSDIQDTQYFRVALTF